MNTGHDSSHSITLCRSVGHGIINIQSVPNDQVKQYLSEGYHQCESNQLGDVITEPTQHKVTNQEISIPQNPPALPVVGGGMDDLIMISLFSFMVYLLVRRWSRA